MRFKVRIQNIGKLTDAEIRIGDFTVFAGPNNTGKSFVSKLLYSLFNAMNANHIATHIENLVRPVKMRLARFMRWCRSDGEDTPLSSLAQKIEDLGLTEEVEKLMEIAIDYPVDDSGGIDEIAASLNSQTDKIAEQMEIMFKDVTNFIRAEKGRAEKKEEVAELERLFRSLLISLREMQKGIEGKESEDLVVAGMEHEIRQNLTRNFQVTELADLRREESESSEIHVEDFGRFRFINGDIEFDVTRTWLQQLQDYSNVIYLESPVYWKLKNALEDLRYNPRRSLRRRREQLSGVPEYFYDLARKLRFEYIGDMAFPGLYEKLTGRDIIGGKIVISERGDLLFQENERNFSLHTTAMGVANLGILGLLIERKVLDEDTLLFIDEPEAHLHPAWQVVMAEALFELARQGVNVVIATHSIDILKWLEVHVKKNPEDERLVALNQFPVEKSETDEDFRMKLAKIKRELTEPFSQLFVDGI